MQQDINSSVNEIKNENILSIFPNPVSENLFVSFKAESFASQSTLEILSIDGRLVREIILENVLSANLTQSIQINLSDLNAGIYFVSVNNGEHNYTKKVIKK